MSRASDDPDANTAGEGPSTTPPERGGPGPLASLLVCLLILAAGAGAIWVIFQTEPEATRVAATRETAMPVNVTTVRSGTFRPTIVATGTVEPAREIVLRSRVEGRVVEHAPGFVPGGTVAQGEPLLRLDAADYRNALRQRRNELDQALADLRIEQGRQQLAEEEIRLLEESLSGENRALVLREPQIDAARARVESARTAVEQAELELQRTTIEAPFDVHVLGREVDVGSQVAPGDTLARLVGSDTYWIETTVPVSKLRWLTFPGDDGDEGAPVRIRNRGAWPEGVHRRGRLYKRVGTLDERTRMARVLVAVDDPLVQDERAADKPRLMLGAFVQARIGGRPVSGVVRLERDYVRQDDTVWVMHDGELDIREVSIVLRDSRYAYIDEGLETGDRVVTSNLATVRDGVPLRLQESAPTSGSGDGGSGGP